MPKKNYNKKIYKRIIIIKMVLNRQKKITKKIKIKINQIKEKFK